MTVCPECHGKGTIETPVYAEHHTMYGKMAEQVLLRIDEEKCDKCYGRGVFDIETQLRPYQREAIKKLMSGDVRIAVGKIQRSSADLSVMFGMLGISANRANQQLGEFRNAFDLPYLTAYGRRTMVYWKPATGKKKHYLRRQTKRVQRYMDRANQQMTKALLYEHL